jgi:DNA polymerase-3 subunit beta
LFDIARKLPEGSQVSTGTRPMARWLIQRRPRAFNLSTLPRDDFPIIAEGDLPTQFELPARR